MLSHKYHAVLAAALALPLTGCWKEQQQAYAKCNAAISPNAESPRLSQIENHMTRCMSKEGYDIAYGNAHCVDVADPRLSPYCYIPKGFFAGIGNRLEMIGQPGPTPPETPQ